MVTNGGPDYNSQYGPRYGADDYIAALATKEAVHGPSSYVVPIGFGDFIFDSRDDHRGVDIYSGCTLYRFREITTQLRKLLAGVEPKASCVID